MNTLDTFNSHKVAEEVLSEIQILKSEYDRLAAERAEKYKEVVDGYFLDIFKESDDLRMRVYSSSVDFAVTRGGEYNEILRFSFRSSNYSPDAAFDKIDTGFYSTSESDEFELERMITIGKVGNVLRYFGDEILFDLTEARKNFGPKLQAAEEVLAEAQERLHSIKLEEANLRKASMMSKLEKEGIEFEFDKTSSRYNVSFDIKFNWTVTNVTKVKLLSTTPSGKSARLEITSLVRNREYELVETTLEETVRMDKLENFLYFNSSSMINN